jgi:hypothetical protein
MRTKKGFIRVGIIDAGHSSRYHLIPDNTIALRQWVNEHQHESLDFTDSQLVECDFSGLRIRDCSFRSAYFYEGTLTGAILDEALFNEAQLVDVDLTETSLIGARFYGATLSQCKLAGADLSCARFLGTTFRDCHFSGAKFTLADFGDTVFADCDLRGNQGLDQATHLCPSVMGVDTLLRSQGDIPPEFLRGCGFPDHVIAYVKSLSQSPIQYYTCFLSHSSKDEAFVRHLYDKLQGTGVRCWYFPESARTGQPLKHEIDRAVRLYDKLVVVCSLNSLTSQPVIDEIEEGLKREQEEEVRRLKDEDEIVTGRLSMDDFAKRHYHTQVLFPIMTDDFLLDGWNHPLQHVIKKRVVADFRKWKDHDSFTKQLDKLLRDLNAQDAAPLVVAAKS